MVRKKKKTSVATPNKPAAQPKSETKKCGLCRCRHPYGCAVIVSLLIVFIYISTQFLPQAYQQLFPQQPKAEENPVVATVNGRDIRRSDVAEFAQSMPQLAGVPFEAVYPRLLDSLVNMRVIANAADKSDIEKQPDVQQALTAAREQILSQAYLANTLEKLMTQDKLREIYLEQVRNFPRQSEIRARHILVKTKAEADKIRQQLKSGADFVELVKKNSLAKENDGDLGYFTQNMMIPEFGDVVFKLKKGDISEAIETPMGWHIVQVNDKRLAAPPAFNDVQEELQQIFAAQNIQNILAQERQKQNVKILKPTL